MSEAPLRAETSRISVPLIPANVPSHAQVSFMATYGTSATAPAYAMPRAATEVSTVQLTPHGRGSSRRGPDPRARATDARRTAPVRPSTWFTATTALSGCWLNTRVTTSMSSPKPEMAVTEQQTQRRRRRICGADVGERSVPTAAGATAAAVATTTRFRPTGASSGPRAKSGIPRVAQIAPRPPYADDHRTTAARELPSAANDMSAVLLLRGTTVVAGQPGRGCRVPASPARGKPFPRAGDGSRYAEQGPELDNPWILILVLGLLMPAVIANLVVLISRPARRASRSGPKVPASARGET